MNVAQVLASVFLFSGGVLIGLMIGVLEAKRESRRNEAIRRMNP